MAHEYTEDYHIIKDDRGYVLGLFGFGDSDPVLFNANPLGKSLSASSGLIAVPVKIVEIQDGESSE
jgi:hypothetical protein